MMEATVRSTYQAAILPKLDNIVASTIVATMDAPHPQTELDIIASIVNYLFITALKKAVGKNIIILILPILV